MPTRRQFLQVGVAGAAVLATAGYMARDRRNAPLVAALVPVVLAGALPAAPHRETAIREVTQAFERAVAGLAPSVQDEVDQLLGVLRFAPTRVALAGLWKPVPESPPEDIAAFLTRWRESRFDLLRAGYAALTQLIQASWYGNTSSWPAIGYPGPPRLAP